MNISFGYNHIWHESFLAVRDEVGCPHLLRTYFIYHRQQVRIKPIHKGESKELPTDIQEPLNIVHGHLWRGLPIHDGHGVLDGLMLFVCRHADLCPGLRRHLWHCFRNSAHEAIICEANKPVQPDCVAFKVDHAWQKQVILVLELQNLRMSKRYMNICQGCIKAFGACCETQI